VIITKRLMGKAIATWLGPTGDAARRAVTELRERVTKSPRVLALYYDIADPWSYLMAQAASRLVEAYPVELAVHVVTPPATDVAPQPVMRAKHAVRDAQHIAEYFDLEFAGKREADSGSVRDVGSSLIRERPPREQLAAILELSKVLWANDKKALAKLLGTLGTESHMAIPPALNANYEAMRKAGHYQPGAISYAGEWYTSIDRLPYLEAALAKDLGSDVAHVVSRRPETDRGPLAIAETPEGKTPQPLGCELWFSFRSPYSYLALEQIEDVLAPYKLPLQLRPVLPMVTRGLPMPNVKRLYIVRDVKREADRLNIPFGEICDPLGKGVEHCVAIAYWANQRGRLLPFAKSAMRAAWSEARDLAEYVDLRHVVERAELPWNEAKDVLADPAATKWAQTNVTDLAVFGLWGVPSFKVGDFVAWGQDRLPLLADRLRRNALVQKDK
jgi:2-hydroxychromene-2-carboxylate isomerase